MARARGQTALALGDRKANPARSRGLERASADRAPCPPPDRTPLPERPTDVEFLALLTRVRATRIATGELSWTGQPLKRLYDIRSFKSAWAEHAYIYRLAAGGRFGGTAATSMPQLVRGLARFCHPSWELTDDEFVDRDRYHTAVRPRLRDLQAMGLLDWRIGIDDAGEERRTDLVLRPVPELMPDELTAATARLALWEERYGSLLNTGSQSGVLDAPVVAAPLDPGERAHRAITRGKRRREARLRVSEHNCAPPCGAGPEAQNGSANDHLTEDVNACVPSSRVTRPRPRDRYKASSAPKHSETASLTIGGEVFASESVVDVATSAAAQRDAFLERAARAAERVAAEKCDREALYALIASQATRRAGEVATWPSTRGWPLGRLREAWVVARRGALYVAEWSAESRWGAGPLEPDDLERLRRAAARFERHRDARPAGYPELGLAALLHIAAIARERDAKPQTLHYGILELDQESTRMRAAATANAADRRDRQAARARRRVFPPAPAPGQLVFRRASTDAPWPAWVALDAAGDPIIVDGELQFAEDAGGIRPQRSDPWYRDTLRDAYLLAGLWPPLGTDGRAAMAADQEAYVDEHGDDKRRARPGPYALPPERRGDDVDPATREFAQRSGISLSEALRVDPDRRDELLEQLRARDARRERAESSATQLRLSSIDVSAHHPQCPCDACAPPPDPERRDER